MNSHKKIHVSAGACGKFSPNAEKIHNCCSEVNVSIAKTANFMMNILLFQVLRSENTVYSCFGV